MKNNLIYLLIVFLSTLTNLNGQIVLDQAQTNKDRFYPNYTDNVSCNVVTTQSLKQKIIISSSGSLDNITLFASSGRGSGSFKANVFIYSDSNGNLGNLLGVNSLQLNSQYSPSLNSYLNVDNEVTVNFSNNQPKINLLSNNSYFIVIQITDINGLGGCNSQGCSCQNMGGIHFINSNNDLYLNGGLFVNSSLTPINIFSDLYFKVFLNNGTPSNTANNNIFIGTNTGTLISSGSKNTSLGHESGKSLTTGEYNTNLGYSSGDYTSTGRNNTFLGALSNTLGNNLVNNSTAIGFNARVKISDAIVLGDTSNINLKVGIGTSSPKYKLDLKGVLNLSIGYNNPVIKINEQDFIATNKSGDLILSNFKVKSPQSDNWADDVFNSNYKLQAFSDVIKFVKVNKHLPDIPTSKEIIIEGIDIHKQFSLQLRKIEELYLYLNEFINENEKLRKRIIDLENANKTRMN